MGTPFYAAILGENRTPPMSKSSSDRASCTDRLQMETSHRRRIHVNAVGLIRLSCTALFAAATTTEAAITRVPETTDVPLSLRAAVAGAMPLPTVAVAMPQENNTSLHPSAPRNMVVEQSLGDLQPSVTVWQQKQRQRSQLGAVNAALLAVVCLAVAFVVLQCVRNAPGSISFVSGGKRALSDSELEEPWMERCIENADEEGEEGGDAEAVQEETLTEGAGESKALQALEQLRCVVNLGLQTMPCLPFDKKAYLLVLLLAISTQELVLYGVYSTPQVELERQRTMDFILSVGKQAVAALEADDQRLTTRRRRRRMLKLLEQFRTARQQSNLDALAVEATISVYRITQCKEALHLLQSWVEGSTPIPRDVWVRALRVLSFTRQTGEGRLRADATANSWIEAAQAGLGFLRPNKVRKVQSHMSIEEQMRKLMPRYRRLARALVQSIESATTDQPLDHHVQAQSLQREEQGNHLLENRRKDLSQKGEQQENNEHQLFHQQQSPSSSHISDNDSAPRRISQPVAENQRNQPLEHHHEDLSRQGDQQQQKDNQTLHEQQHPSTSHISDNNDDSRPTSQPVVDQPATVTNSVLAHALHHPLPSPVPRQGPLLTTSNTLVNLPLLDPTQSSPADSQQNIPIAHAERWEQSPPHSTPSGYESQQATMAQEWSMFNSSTANSVLRADAPLFTPTVYRHQAGMQHHIHPVSSDASYVWWYAPSPFGFEVDSLAAFPRPLPLPRPIPAATLSPSGYIRTMFPLTASSTGSPTPRHPLPTPQFPSPRPSADPSRPPQPTEGLSLRFSRPILHSPPSDVPRHGPEPSALFSGSRRSIPSWRFEPPRAFWPPTGGGAQGDVHSPSPHSLVDLNPVMTLVAEAFPSAQSDSDSPTGSGQRQHLDQGWPHVPGSDRP